MSSLPAPLPADPLPLMRQWLDEAAAGPTRNPWAMALATAGRGGPAVRFVLLKTLSVERGFAVFHTNYGSRKADELAENAAAAAAMYWADRGRQLRFEGPVTRSPASESDAYFASRPRGSQINAWASEQSRPLTSEDALRSRIEGLEREFPADDPLPRPGHWGGYRLWLGAVELWCEGTDRFHERVRYERPLRPCGDSEFSGGEWRHGSLQP